MTATAVNGAALAGHTLELRGAVPGVEITVGNLQGEDMSLPVRTIGKQTQVKVDGTWQNVTFDGAMIRVELPEVVR